MNNTRRTGAPGFTDPEIIDALLAAAGLSLLENERTQLVKDYPTLRAQTAALYAYPDALEPATLYNPLTAYQVI